MTYYLYRVVAFYGNIVTSFFHQLRNDTKPNVLAPDTVKQLTLIAGGGKSPPYLTVTLKGMLIIE